MTHPEEQCESCPKPAVACYRAGQGTGHSEHVCACEDHTEDPGVEALARLGAGWVNRAV